MSTAFDARLREYFRRTGCVLVIGPGDGDALRALVATPSGETVAVSDDEDLTEAIAGAVGEALDASPAEHHPMYSPPLTPNRVWSTAYKNDLPDSAFLYVRHDCVERKDDQGRSHPLSCRELPVKNKSGSYDKAHVRNAIARAPQLKGVPEATKLRLQKRAQSVYAREFGYSQ